MSRNLASTFKPKLAGFALRHRGFVLSPLVFYGALVVGPNLPVFFALSAVVSRRFMHCLPFRSTCLDNGFTLWTVGSRDV
jgi:hypothetical protein